MIRVLEQLNQVTDPLLFTQIFRGRAMVFGERLQWPIATGQNLETDEFDCVPEIRYVIFVEHGNVLGSLRVIPTSGNTLLRRTFAGEFQIAREISTPNVWECSRFCVHYRSIRSTEIGRSLLIGLCEWAYRRRVEAIVANFYRPMLRVYSRIGWSPEIIDRSPINSDHYAGRWRVSLEDLAEMRALQARLEMPRERHARVG
jgi:N-acyl-L-homoserine lactone synthetase